MPARRYGALVAATVLLLTACGGEEPAPPAVDGPGAPTATLPTATAPPAGASGGSDVVPDEQALCGAVAEGPIVDALGGAIAVRAFNGPFGSGIDISCVWEASTRSVNVTFWLSPGFRELVDNDILDEYGQGEFGGLGVEAHRNVYKGIIAAGPHGWGVDVRIAGTFVPTDAQLAAIAEAALAAAEQVSGG